MQLFVGLGNPGSKYAGNRHNIGFMAIDAIASHFAFASFRARFQGLAAEGVIAGEKVLLLKPQTFMNRSGASVGAAARFYKLPVEAVTVFYDEIDLAPGKVRVKRGGGHAGHNGIRDIAAHLGAAFRRVRIGVGHPGDKALVHRHVLQDFAVAERQWLVPLLDAVADAVPHLVVDEDSRFMSDVAHRAPPPGGAARKASAEKKGTDE